jgi:hypothetical protein
MLDALSDRANALIVFSKQHRWESHLVQKFSHQYCVTTIIAAPIFFRGGSRAVEKTIELVIREHSIDIVFLDTEFLPIVDSLVIDSIPQGILRVLLAFDDVLQHGTNLRHALCCHAVLTADPVSVNRFWQRGIPAHLICLEGSTSLYHPAEGKVPCYDVLFFGDPTRGDRPSWLSYLAENGVQVFTPPSKSLSYDELAEYIRAARIVLNFSKVGAAPYSPLVAEERAPYLYFKGRIVEAGLSGVPCLSESFPGAEEMFGQEALQCFSTPEECLLLIRNLLADEGKRASLGKALYELCIGRYADAPQSFSIAKFLATCPAERPTGSHANIVYCAQLLSRKIFRLLPHSPWLAIYEIFRLISRRILGGSHLKNLMVVIMLTVISAISVAMHLVFSRHEAVPPVNTLPEELG